MRAIRIKIIRNILHRSKTPDPSTIRRIRPLNGARFPPWGETFRRHLSHMRKGWVFSSSSLDRDARAVRAAADGVIKSREKTPRTHNFIFRKGLFAMLYFLWRGIIFAQLIFIS